MSPQELFQSVLSTYDEMLGYEYLYALDKSSLKKVCAATIESGRLPSEAAALEIGLLHNDLCDRIAHYLDSKRGKFSVSVNGSYQYPQKLSDAEHQVPLLYYRGSLDLLRRPSVSVVGARKASDDGIQRARQIGRDLANANITVVSGLASGIDAAAMSAASEAGGSLIGVIGTPIDEIYPIQNAWLHEVASRSGLLVSQVPLYKYSTQPFPSKKVYFKERNITMAAISDATIIVEASDTSGTLIQADACFKQGRPLFILESALTNESIKWPDRFIKAGAQVISSTQPVIEYVNGLY